MTVKRCGVSLCADENSLTSTIGMVVFAYAYTKNYQTFKNFKCLNCVISKSYIKKTFNNEK